MCEIAVEKEKRKNENDCTVRCRTVPVFEKPNWSGVVASFLFHRITEMEYKLKFPPFPPTILHFYRENRTVPYHTTDSMTLFFDKYFKSQIPVIYVRTYVRTYVISSPVSKYYIENHNCVILIHFNWS